MNYGIELINELTSAKNAAVEDLKRIIDEANDDSYYSHAHNRSRIAEIDLKLSILANNGMHSFDCILDINTNEVVSDKIVQGKFGPCYVVEDEAMAAKFGKFIGIAARESTYTKKGLKTGKVDRPAWVKLIFNGTGMAAAASAQPGVFRSDINYFTGE